jgi:hypothetical protein
MSEGISENSSLKTNTGFAIKLISAVVFFVYSGAMIMASINALELDLERVKHDVERNIFFVENWPKGTIGALPDDQEQNMRLTFLEKQIAKHEDLLEDMRYGVAK